MSAELQASRRDATLILAISNPGSGNALHPDIYAAAIETLTTAERDDDIRAVILTGAGQCFAGGSHPPRQPDNRSPDSSMRITALDQLHGWIDAIRACPKPVIAAVEGTAADAGFSLALACDLIVAGSSAQFVIHRAKAGLTPEGGASWFLAQTLPHQSAFEILLQEEGISAQRLHELGIVNRIVADGSALDTALNWADRLAAIPSDAIERIKTLTHEARHNSLAHQFATEKRHFLESLHHRNAP